MSSTTTTPAEAGTIPTCPLWCSRPAGHDYDSTVTDVPGSGAAICDADGYLEVPVGSLFRNHVTNPKLGNVEVVQEEALAGTILVRGKPFIVVYDEDDKHLNPTEARAMADSLNQLADLLDDLLAE